MGCDVLVEGATSESAAVRALFAQRDAVFSRFRPESELNPSTPAAAACLVTPLFARMVEAALRAREQTDGLVDPTLGAALEGAGYDRDFSYLEPTEAPLAPPRRRGTSSSTGACSCSAAACSST